MSDGAKVEWRGIENLVRTLDIAIDIVTGRGRREAALTSAALVAERSRGRAPVKTGALLSSIGYAKEGNDSAVVKATAHHAPFVHYGTRFMRARPFILSSLYAEQDAIERIFDLMAGEALSHVRGV